MKVVKTIKLYIGGEFKRSESGKSFTFQNPQSDSPYARLSETSDKDFRNSVEKAKRAQKAWSQKTAFNRSQIIYRMAEMCEGKRSQFEELFRESLNKSEEEAKVMVDEAMDTFIYYAGFCDKFLPISSGVNPVNGPYFNFTKAESMGVVALIEDDTFSFQRLIDQICSIIVSGNSLIVILGAGCPMILAPLAEVFATSDLPLGTINLLTGKISKLKSVIAKHREVSAISLASDNPHLIHDIKLMAVDNMKRVISAQREERTLENILQFVEYKTMWQSMGL